MGIPQQTVSDEIQKFTENGNLSKSGKALFQDDFEHTQHVLAGKVSKKAILASLHRHLTGSQRAAAAFESLEYYEAAGEAREQAARDFKTNRQYVSDIKRIHEHSPELYETVGVSPRTLQPGLFPFEKEKRGAQIQGFSI